MRNRLSLAVAFSFFATLIAARAGAENPDWPPSEDIDDLSDPSTWPDDPSYGEQWNLQSFIPAGAQESVREAELAIGSGMHADRAWQKTIGDPRVVIAVLDSGIKWGNDELVNKIALNRGELPPPDSGCPDPVGVDAWDRDGDGALSVRDYTNAAVGAVPLMATVCDTRLLAADQNANGMLDGQDLIVAFEDGVDGDENGWLDDIAGWDALENDNDPADDTDFGHGTGEAEDSCAETDNGRGSAGVCPLCRALMVRAGQSFVVEVNDFAVGVIFAVESGAAVVQEALGSINSSTLSREAIDYAWRNNVTIVASAADEDSFHHNFPGTNNHAMYVHAITHNGLGHEPDGTTTTFLNFNNCTNYGAQLVLSTPGDSCSSEATGKTSGMAGLFYAAALQAGLAASPGADPETDLYDARRLTHDEVRSLLQSTVDDIDVPKDEWEALGTYESGPGWDQRFGYGRPNTRAVVDAILGGDIPPVVDVTAPTWFEMLYPDRTPTVTIEGRVSARDQPVTGVVEWGAGIDPDDGDFTEICAIDAAGPFSCDWDISKLAIDNPAQPAPDNVVNRHMVTVRVRATRDGGGLPGEYRKAFHVLTDPDLLAGFPIWMGGSGESSPKLADLDGDGAREIVIGTADGLVHAYRADGSELSGFPAAADAIPQLEGDFSLAATGFFAKADAALTRASITATVAVGDLDGDGIFEIVAADLDRRLYVFSADGTPRAGFPVDGVGDGYAMDTPSHVIADGFFSSPALGDLDGDGALEIVTAGMDGRVYAWHDDGATPGGFPVTLRDEDEDRVEYIVASPALGDLEGDGTLEIVVGTTEDYTDTGRLYVVEADGTIADGFPENVGSIAVLPYIGSGLPSSPALADVDGDGTLEIALLTTGLFPKIFRADGEDYALDINNLDFDDLSTVDPEQAPLITLISNASFGDLDDDGTLDLLAGGGSSLVLTAFERGGRRQDFAHLFGAWSTATGTYLSGFPALMDDWQFFMTAAVADVDGDGHPEAIYGSAGYYLHAFNGCGQEVAGWPKFTGQWIIASPAVGDLDGDGTLEVVAPTRSGWLYAWHTEGADSGRIDWESFHHDNANTGNFATPLSQGVAKASGPLVCATVGEGESE
ncbi:MAG: FG-GAP-like repeat-containing protein, partial [Myxococcota bacterium]